MSRFRNKALLPAPMYWHEFVALETLDKANEIKGYVNTQNQKEPADDPTKKQVYILLSGNIFLNNGGHFIPYRHGSERYLPCRSGSVVTMLWPFGTTGEIFGIFFP